MVVTQHCVAGQSSACSQITIIALQVKREMKRISRDPRKVLVLLAITQWVYAEKRTTFFKQARAILRKRITNALIIVSSGDGIRLMYNDPDDPAAAISGRDFPEDFSHTKQPGLTNHATVTAAIDYNDFELELLCRVIVVIGYLTVGRIIDVRGTIRTLTHVIAAPCGDGEMTSNVAQLLHRPFGYKVRQVSSHVFCFVDTVGDAISVTNSFVFIAAET